MPAQTRAVPRTPVRQRPNDGEDVAHIPVKDMTLTFRGQDLFGFKGKNKYHDGKLFITRFTGTITCHENEEFSKILDADDVPEKWLNTVWQALLQLN